jgi:hypothetical protein
MDGEPTRALAGGASPGYTAGRGGCRGGLAGVRAGRRGGGGNPGPFGSERFGTGSAENARL